MKDPSPSTGAPSAIRFAVVAIDEPITDHVDAVFAQAGARDCATVAMPLLGTVHGRMEDAEAVDLLARALSAAAPAALTRVLLMVRPERQDSVLEALREHGLVGSPDHPRGAGRGAGGA